MFLKSCNIFAYYDIKHITVICNTNNNRPRARYWSSGFTLKIRKGKAAKPLALTQAERVIQCPGNPHQASG